MRKEIILRAKYLTHHDVAYAFTLYQINFGRYWVPHHTDPRVDAVEALEAIQKGKPV